MTKLDEIEARLNAATPGPWYVHYTDDEFFMNATCVSTQPGPECHDHLRGMAPGECDETSVVAITLLQYPRLADVDDGRWDENAELIAHAPEDLRYLLDALREAEAERDRLRRLWSSCVAGRNRLVGKYKELRAERDRLRRSLDIMEHLHRVASLIMDADDERIKELEEENARLRDSEGADG